MRGNNIPINEPLRKFTDAFDCNSFQASNGCVRGWKERYVQIASLYVLTFENQQYGKWSTFVDIFSMIS